MINVFMRLVFKILFYHCSAMHDVNRTAEAQKRDLWQTPESTEMTGHGKLVIRNKLNKGIMDTALT